MRRALAIVGLTAFGSLVSFGCGGGDSSATTGGGAGGAGGGAGGSGAGGGVTEIACTGQPSAMNLTGVWAARGSLAVTLKGKPGGAITTCPVDQVGESHLLLLLDIHANASDPTKLDTIQATLCSLDLPTVTALVGDCTKDPTTLVSTTLEAPQRFIDALPAIASDPVSGTLASSKPGAAISMDRFTVDVGTSKSGAALPKWNADDSDCQKTGIGNQMVCVTDCVDDCAAMRDDDHDGFPGVTLEVCGKTPSDTNSGVQCNFESPDAPGATLQGKAFLDIQVDPQFAGTALSSCEIRGHVDTSVLYNLVGGDIYLAGAPISVASAIGSLPIFTVSPNMSSFRMVRIDGKYGTDDLKADPSSDPKAACAIAIKNMNSF